MQKKTTRAEQVKAYLTPGEKSAVEKAAAVDGLPVSTWLRLAALHEAGILPKGKGR